MHSRWYIKHIGRSKDTREMTSLSSSSAKHGKKLLILIKKNYKNKKKTFFPVSVRDARRYIITKSYGFLMYILGNSTAYCIHVYMDR